MSDKLGKIRIGSKNLAVYIAAVAFELETSDEVVLSAIGSNINKLERLVRLFARLSEKNIVEISRGEEPVGDVSAVLCKLRRR